MALSLYEACQQRIMVDVFVVGQNEIQVKMILTWFDSHFPLSSNPNYS